MYISMFMPCYNEEKILEKNTFIVLQELRKLKKTFELVLVDDTSTDNTLKIAEKLAKKYKEVKFMHYEDGPSRRENLLRSFLRGEGEIIAFIDTDLSTDPSAIKDLINYTKEYDIVIGSRYAEGSKIKRTILRRVVSYIWNTFMKIYFRSSIQDHFQGFKAFRRQVIIDLLDETGVGNKQRKMFWDAEMLVRAQAKGYKIKEFPIKWKEGIKTTLRIKGELSMIPYALKLKKKIQT